MNNTSNKLNYLDQKILVWAEEKGILEHGNTMSQAIKTQEECLELLQAVNSQDHAEIKDAIGDIFVTIAIQAKMNDMSITDCVESAYNIISKRTGTMSNGMFVKDAESNRANELAN